MGWKLLQLSAASIYAYVESKMAGRDRRKRAVMLHGEGQKLKSIFQRDPEETSEDTKEVEAQRNRCLT